MRILFVTSNRLGDAVLSTGLLDYLIRAHPDASITVVCGPVAEGVFARMPNRQRTIIMQKQPHARHWLRLWACTTTRVWDLVVDIRGSALSWLIPTRRRAIFRRRAGSKIEQIGAVLNLSPVPYPVVWVAAVDRARATALLPVDRPIIALAPTANWQPKIWPASRFAAAFEHVRTSVIAGAVPVVLGGSGASEREMAAPLLAALPEAIDLVGALSLPEAAAVLQQAALFLGNDSGLMHLAAAAGAPTVGLFGPTDATIYRPTGRAAVAVVNACMAAISVEQVLAAAKTVVAGGRGQQGSINAIDA